MNDFIKFLEKYNISANEFVIMYKAESGLTPEQHGMIYEGAQFFKKSKSKSIPRQLRDHPEMVKQYLEIWPRMTLPSGKPARASERVIIKCFTWFFNEYNYSWSTVLTATEEYLINQESSKYKTCRTSQYFVDKTNGGIRESLLADYCLLVEEGEDRPHNYFKEKVV